MTKILFDQKVLFVTEDEKYLLSDASVEYVLGLPKFVVKLPSRREKCQFIMKPITHTVGDFLEMLKIEDRGIDRALVTTTGSATFCFSRLIFARVFKVTAWFKGFQSEIKFATLREAQGLM